MEGKYSVELFRDGAKLHVGIRTGRDTRRTRGPGHKKLRNTRQLTRRIAAFGVGVGQRNLGHTARGRVWPRQAQAADQGAADLMGREGEAKTNCNDRNATEQLTSARCGVKKYHARHNHVPNKSFCVVAILTN